MFAACGEGVSVPIDAAVDAPPERTPVAVETVAPESVQAGQMLTVTCLWIDETGETFTPPPEVRPLLRVVPEGSVVRSDSEWIAERVGRIEVSCSFPGLRLLDDTPASVEIVPGPPAFVSTRLERDALSAGDSVRASCEVSDAYGNTVQGASPSLRADPSEEGNAFEGTLGTFTRAGVFDVFCDLSGAVSTPARLEVAPALPATLVIARVPDQPVYRIGQVIDLARIAQDRFGNPVPDAEIPVFSIPGGQRLGEGRYRYSEDGRYVLTANVIGPTQGDVRLAESTVIVVDENGPVISCDDPFDGGVLDRRPGTTITFRGSVDDLSGIASVRVNGTAVSVDAGGAFSQPIPTRYGINFVDLVATDTVGRETARTCSFLVSDVWVPDDEVLGGAVSLRLRQAAFDDSSRTGALNSFADILHSVLNSSELRDTLHAELTRANPLKPDACDSRVIGICVLRSEVNYRDSELRGPNSTSLQLIDEGLRATVRLENIRFRIQVRGRVAGIPYNTTGWVTFDSLEVRVDFDVRLHGGRPQITVRPGSVTSSVGRIDSSFSGLDGALVNIVVDLFQGRVRDLIAGLVRGWVSDNFNELLDGLLGGLDIDTLGTSFEVPRLDSEETIRLSFGVGFSSIDTDSSRALFGVSTRFFAPAAHARPTLGAPVRRGLRRLDVDGGGAAAVAVHESVLNQALHALWRGGFFDATLDAASIGTAVPEGVVVGLSTGLPPVAEVTEEGRMNLSLGAMVMRLQYPDLLSEPLMLTLGARASMRVGATGEVLSFDDFRLEELRFSTAQVSLDEDTRDTIEGLLTRLLGGILPAVLEDALPALPIPTFELPASLSGFGLPGGAELGLVRSTLSPEPPHLVLRGDFSVR